MKSCLLINCVFFFPLYPHDSPLKSLLFAMNQFQDLITLLEKEGQNATEPLENGNQLSIGHTQLCFYLKQKKHDDLMVHRMGTPR